MAKHMTPVPDPTLSETPQDAAQRVRERFSQNGVLLVNLLAAPGAGITSLIKQTLKALPETRIGVVEGNIAGNRDIAKVLDAGAVSATQVDVGPTGYLDAMTLELALTRLELDKLDMLLIENIGDLIRAADYDLGEDLRICLVSASGSDDVAVKFPAAFITCDAVVLNKVDLLGRTEFSTDTFYTLLRKVNDTAHILELSCRTKAGLELWLTYLKRHLVAVKAVSQESA